MTNSQLVDMTVHLHQETEMAVFVSDTADEADAVWLPRSKIEIVKSGDVYEVTLPEWLAIERGLV